jgi:uncharacterized membrane protein (DUF373 family)
MDEAGDDRPGRPGSVSRPGRPPRRGIWGVTSSIFVLEHAQDVVTVVVGLVLIVLAAVILISGIADFIHSLTAAGASLSASSVTNAATSLLDEVLLVLILVEIVHTVVLSLHSHRLVAQPFIIVGLVAVIRKILFVLSGQKLVSTSVLALLLALVAVFVASYIFISLFEKSAEPEDSAGS